jgi:transposase
VQELGGQAYIPFKKNSTGRAGRSPTWHKMFHYFQFKRNEFMQHYHARSNAESVFSAIKKKFGETLKSKKPIAQENEMLCKILAYNITVLIQEMHELGVQPNFCS